MSNMENLRDVLDKTAQEIILFDSNPRAWRTWTVYLLERLEEKATQNPAHMESFKEMLAALQDELRNRLRTGGW